MNEDASILQLLWEASAARACSLLTFMFAFGWRDLEEDSKAAGGCVGCACASRVWEKGLVVSLESFSTFNKDLPRCVKRS